MTQPSPQLLIVGAGPVGLTCALVLTRMGIRVRIVDEQPSMTSYSKALVLWRGSLKALHPFVDSGRFEAGHPEVRGATLSSRTESIAHMSFEDEGRGVVPGLFIPQYDTESCLIEALREQGVEVERGSRLDSFSQSNGGVSARITTGNGNEDIEVAWLIGCDGGHSTIRKTLGLSFDGQSSEHRWLIADVDIDQEQDGHVLRIVQSSQGAVICFPISGARWRIIVDAGEVESGGVETPPAIEEIQRAIDDRSSLGWKIQAQHWLAHFHINERQVDSYVNGRVLLAGDAAHVHTPAGGQGMNTGIQDAVNLAWKLAMVIQEQAPESLMHTYHSERHPVGAYVIKASRLMIRAAMNTSPIAIGIGKVLAPIMTTLPMIRKRAMAFLTEDFVSYRDGPLADVRSVSSSHASGDAFPDCLIRMRDGDHRPAIDLLKDPGFTLVIIGDHEEPRDLLGDFSKAGTALHIRRVATGGDAEDNEGRLIDAFDLPDGGFVLVRPDSFIAVVSEDAERLVAWFSGITSGRSSRSI
tara:strand:+ start:231 stop:1805 length:1575 start_codon:yes stop_codon:yes gene_type:complete